MGEVRISTFALSQYCFREYGERDRYASSREERNRIEARIKDDFGKSIPSLFSAKSVLDQYRFSYPRPEQVEVREDRASPSRDAGSAGGLRRVVKQGAQKPQAAMPGRRKVYLYRDPDKPYILAIFSLPIP